MDRHQLNWKLLLSIFGIAAFLTAQGPQFTGGGNVVGTNLTANLPVIGKGGASIGVGTRTGNTTAYVTSTGALTPGDCGSIDANGNLVDAGFPCGSGSGSGTVSSALANQIARYATNGTTVSGSGVLSDDGTNAYVAGALDIKANPFTIELPNSATGTTLNKLAKAVIVGGVLQAQIITTSSADQGAALGCVIAGAGTTGTAIIMIAGTGSCYFDAATTAGHIAVPSSTSAGALHDTGSTSSPSTGEVLATVGATNACGSPPCLIAGNLFLTPDLLAGNGNGGGGGPPAKGGPTSNQNIRTVGATFGSFEFGAAALTGSKTYCVPTYYAGFPQSVEIIGDVSGSVTVDVLTVAHSSWTGRSSTSSITASDIPALSSAARYTDTSLTGWTYDSTHAFPAGTDFCFAMTSPTTVAGVAISVKVAAN